MPGTPSLRRRWPIRPMRKLELLDVVYGNDESEEADQALALVDKYPDMKLIMAPTTVGIGGCCQGDAAKVCAIPSRFPVSVCRKR